LAAVGAILGKLPSPEEYMEYMKNIDSMADDIYRYLNFDQIESFQKSAEDGKRIAAVEIQEISA
jgi:aconitate hydratase 2/2-methylisocitrate dehydratase